MLEQSLNVGTVEHPNMYSRMQFDEVTLFSHVLLWLVQVVIWRKYFKALSLIQVWPVTLRPSKPVPLSPP